MRNCVSCGEEIEGRAGKKFCDLYCKSAHQYKINKEKKPSLFVAIDKQLRLNRRLLKDYNKAGKSTIRKENFLNAGFNPNYFTHYWKNKKGDVYLFCYEFGFLERSEKGKSKYVLVKWQDYMLK